MGIKVGATFCKWLASFALLGLTSCASAPDTPVATARQIDWSRFQSTAILKTYRGGKTFICSAVLLTPRIGLTTAHCISNSDRNQVLVGASLTDPELVTVPVLQKSIRIHPDYHREKSLSHADLAVFKLRRNAPVTVFAHIPAQADTALQAGQSLDRVGFGLRNGVNARTWTEVFYRRLEDRTLIAADRLSVTGDSGSAIFDSTGPELRLLGLHSTLQEEGEVAEVHLPAFTAWLKEAANYPN